MATDSTLGNPIPQARLLLRRAAQLGDLNNMERAEAEAIGANLGGMQRQLLLHAATLALVSMAESLEAMADIQRDGR